MKYYLTIILTISSLLIAQDSPQVPGWWVYFGGALNGASIDPLNDGFDIVGKQVKTIDRVDHNIGWNSGFWYG